ncbi:MAG TPA: SDR family oxidoreductase [Pseudolabrys sp.]|nr:SDR family oxidoreductase [Pseudolabrys sp.]
MQLGLEGRKAIVCASSMGLGKASAVALAREGCSVVINGRDAKRLEEAAVDIAKVAKGAISIAVADLNTAQGRRQLVAACPDADILINNNGGPPPGRYDTWTDDDWQAALESNLLAPISLIKALLPGMRKRKFGRIVNITSARVKTPTARMGLSASARAGLTAFCKGLSVDVAGDNVTINNLLPERIATERHRFMVAEMVERDGITAEQAEIRIAEGLPSKRLGKATEVGDACAYLCSEQAGYITGQNLQLDGGSYRGLI